MLIILKKASWDPVKSLFVNILTCLLLFLLIYLQTLFIFLLTLLWLRWLMEQGFVWLVFLPHSHRSEWQELRNSKGSVGKTIEAFHGAQTATLSAKYFQTMTLKIPFHNCFPLQRETKPCLFLELHAEMRLPQQTGPSPEKPSVILWLMWTNKTVELSVITFSCLDLSIFTKCFCRLSPKMFANTLRQTGTQQKCSGTNSGHDETCACESLQCLVLKWSREGAFSALSHLSSPERGRTHRNLPSSLCVFITLESICLNLDDRNIYQKTITLVLHFKLFKPTVNQTTGSISIGGTI